jgi:carbon storage regulator
MLALTRKEGESIMVGDEIEITIVKIMSDSVRIAIDAPFEITVHRREVFDDIQRENRTASSASVEDADNLDASICLSNAERDS